MEMRQYLEGKGYSIPIQDEVLAWLSDLGYVDDLSFALQLVEDRCRTNPVGELRLVQELRQKGIPEPFIEDAVAHFHDLVDEAALAQELAIKRARHYRGEDRIAAIRKLTGYLRRRGFSMENIRPAVAQAIDDEQEL